MIRLVVGNERNKRGGEEVGEVLPLLKKGVYEVNTV